MKGKATTRKIQAIKTKKKLYDVSIKLLKKHGFDNVTIEDICKKSGVSVGTFYHYFDSKGDIVNEIFRQGDKYFENKVANNLKEGTASEKIISFFKYYADFNESNGVDFMKQLFSLQSKLYIDNSRYMHVLLNDIIKEGQEKHEISTRMSSQEISDFFFVTIRGVIYDWCLHDGSYHMKDAVVKYVENLLTIFRN